MDHVQYLDYDDRTVIANDLCRRGYSVPGWYFWDETEAYCQGPFQDRDEASRKLDEYAKSLDPVQESHEQI